MTSPTIEDEWLWGWDPTPGIVSIWADAGGRVLVWRRIPSSGTLVRETDRFRPWMLLDSLEWLGHSGFRVRTRGLLGRTGLAPDTALIIAPCQAVHTFGMRFAIAAYRWYPRGHLANNRVVPDGKSSGQT